MLAGVRIPSPAPNLLNSRLTRKNKICVYLGNYSLKRDCLLHTMLKTHNFWQQIQSLFRSCPHKRHERFWNIWIKLCSNQRHYLQRCCFGRTCGERMWCIRKGCLKRPAVPTLRPFPMLLLFGVLFFSHVLGFWNPFLFSFFV